MLLKESEEGLPPLMAQSIQQLSLRNGSPWWIRFELFCCKHGCLRVWTSRQHKVPGWDFPVIPDLISGWRHSVAPGRISPLGISDPTGLRIFVASSAQAEVVGLSLTVVTAEGRRGSGKVGSLAASSASELNAE